MRLAHYYDSRRSSFVTVSGGGGGVLRRYNHEPYGFRHDTSQQQNHAPSPAKELMSDDTIHKPMNSSRELVL